MPMMWGGSSWNFQDPKNWVINKSLEQNVQEASTGIQIMGTVIPEALAYKAAQQITVRMAQKAIIAATPTAGVMGSSAGLGTLGAVGGGSVLGLATTGAKLGFDVFLLNWLKDNWWIPALLIGAYMGVKLIK
jgi:hypothetical protein